MTILANEKEREELDAYAGWRIDPTEIGSEWCFLGYDVADPSPISFLSNAGRGEEMPQNRLTWGVHLNEYHLFDDLDKAQAFADYCEVRETMHGPYAVFGLYVIQSLGL